MGLAIKTASVALFMADTSATTPAHLRSHPPQPPHPLLEPPHEWSKVLLFHGSVYSLALHVQTVSAHARVSLPGLD